MARSIKEIEEELLTHKAAQPELEKLDSSSKSAVWRRIFFVVATAFWALEKKWDTLTAEVNRLIKAGKPMSLYWYQQEALRFRYGVRYDEWGQYADRGLSPEALEKSKIVHYAAVERLGRKLLIKVATIKDHDLAPLNSEQIQALERFFNDNGSAGTLIEIHSDKADDLKLEVDIYYNPVVLSDAGSRLDGTAETPVKVAIDDYLKTLGFNGRLSLTALSNAMEAVDGVEEVNIKGAWSKYGDYDYTTTEAGAGPIAELRTLDAGYARLDEASTTIVYINTSAYREKKAEKT